MPVAAWLRRPAEVASKAQELLDEAERREAEGDAAAFAFEADDWAAGPSTSAVAAAYSNGAPAAGLDPFASSRAPLYAETAPVARSVNAEAAAGGRAAPSFSITIPGAAAAAGGSGSAGPGSAFGSFGTPTSGGLRVGAAEFRPGSSGAALGAPAAPQAQQQEPAAVALALASKYLSAQLVAASQEASFVTLKNWRVWRGVARASELAMPARAPGGLPLTSTAPSCLPPAMATSLALPANSTGVTPG